MKEEEKVKAYDEALSRAKECHIDGLSLHQPVKDVIEYIFPELKESEDERIKREILELVSIAGNGNQFEEIKDWLEKQGNKVIDCQDMNNPNGGIVSEDFTGGEGFYKVHLGYLNKKQVEEIEELVRTWNTELNSFNNENIRACIGMCLTDADEQRFKNHNTNLKECIAWLDEKINNCSYRWEKNTTDNKPILNHSVLMKSIYGIAEGEWNGEDWIQYRWSSKIKDSDVLYWMNLSELEKQGNKVID